MTTSKFNAGDEYDFGIVSFSEEDIIRFAERNDPLPFHTNRESAGRHIFNKLVCSGTHPFNHFYVNCWVPAFGESVLCGLAVEGWKFHLPVFAGALVHCKVRVLDVKHYPERNSAKVLWEFIFQNETEQLYQELRMLVLHKEDS